MTTPWKAATIGIAIAGVTAVSTGLTTAWMLRPTAPAQAEPAATVPAPARPVVRHAAAAPLVQHPAPVTRVSSPAVADDCATGGDRALRIAKPGALGALLGAGLGAANGAVADGGKAAGKGAIIGGIAGAAVGTGYGAYKTKNECGSVFGGPSTLTAAR
jgi:hypothetical protein